MQATLGPADLALQGFIEPNSVELLPSSFRVLEAFHLAVLAEPPSRWLAVRIAPDATESLPYNAAGDSLAA